MTWTAPATGFLVNATAGTVSVGDAVNEGGVAMYNQAFSSSESTFTMALKFSFDKTSTAQTAISAIMVARLSDGVNTEFIQTAFIRVANSTNYTIKIWVKDLNLNFNSSNIAESVLGLGETDANSDDLTLELTIVKGASATTWTATGKLINSTTATEIKLISPAAFTVSDAFHASTSCYPVIVAGKHVDACGLHNLRITLNNSGI